LLIQPKLKGSQLLWRWPIRLSKRCGWQAGDNER
jgi:hypothetical protein